MSHQSRFYLHDSDSTAVKLNKMRAMSALVSSDNAIASIREFKVCYHSNRADDSITSALSMML